MDVRWCTWKHTIISVPQSRTQILLPAFTKPMILIKLLKCVES